MSAFSKLKSQIKNLSGLWFFLRSLSKNGLDIVFPIYCLSCNQNSNWLCSDCAKKIHTNSSQTCFVCGNTNLIGNYACGCITNYHFDGLYIAGDFKDKTLERLIKAYKYSFVKILKNHISDFLIRFINDEILDRHINRETALSKLLANKEAVIIPVPIHARRLRWRGFNQSAEIAKIIGEKFSLEINGSLVRTKFFRPQTKLNKDKRQKNIRNSFAWKSEEKAPRNILLIDDIVTTGSTVDECARVLKENGAKNVQVLVIAKK